MRLVAHISTGRCIRSQITPGAGLDMDVGVSISGRDGIFSMRFIAASSAACSSER
jgi:hypothetical protein